MHIEYLRTHVPCASSIERLKELFDNDDPDLDWQREWATRKLRKVEASISALTKRMNPLIELLSLASEGSNRVMVGVVPVERGPDTVERGPDKLKSARCIREAENYLAELDGTMHNCVATRVLCAATTWAYSDLKTFATMMCHRGLFGEFVGVRVANDAAFVDTTAYLFLSDTRKLSILTFRGTEPTNIANWLSNVRMHMAPQEEGAIHAGFLNAGIVVLPLLKDLLLAKGSLAQALLDIKERWCIPGDVFPSSAWQAAIEQKWEKGAETILEELSLEARKRKLQKDSEEEAGDDEEEAGDDKKEAGDDKKEAGDDKKEAGDDKKEAGPALYICGHSLGGAYAAMAGAMIYLEPTLAKVRESLRSVYTFGQPMFADKSFADAIGEKLGDRVFMHRYKKDIVPRLPGRLNGRFHHFGRSYVSDKEDVWVRDKSGHARGNGAVFGMLGSNFIGAVALVKGSFPSLSWLPLPVSWADHSPLHYMRVSQAPRFGWEILGAELGGDAPGESISPRTRSRG